MVLLEFPRASFKFSSSVEQHHISVFHVPFLARLGINGGVICAEHLSDEFIVVVEDYFVGVGAGPAEKDFKRVVLRVALEKDEFGVVEKDEFRFLDGGCIEPPSRGCRSRIPPSWSDSLASCP